MKMINTPQSSNVMAFGYDKDLKILAVTFRSGTYHYFDVPEKVFEDMQKAESVGKFLNSEVKSKGYRYKKQ